MSIEKLARANVRELTLINRRAASAARATYG